MRLIVTGGAGFIGSAVVGLAIDAGHDVLTIDKLTYAGRADALARVAGSSRHRLLKADIARTGEVEAAFTDFDADAVLHLAAETHVDRSIDGPVDFVETNVRGTFELLELSLRHWSRLKAERRERFRFVHVSTDEVFGALGKGGAFDASSPYAPNSPYAASKAAADHFTRAWHQTYGLPTIVTNSTNNYGPRQHAEKFVPTVLRHALAGEAIPIYGTGVNVRDWLYVDDHARGLLRVADVGTPGHTYLFGACCEIANLDLAKLICARLDARMPRADRAPYAAQITPVADRPGHDFRYAIDPSNARAELGWAASRSFEQALAETLDWYLDHRDWLVPAAELGRLGVRAFELLGMDS